MKEPIDMRFEASHEAAEAYLQFLAGALKMAIRATSMQYKICDASITFSIFMMINSHFEESAREPFHDMLRALLANDPPKVDAAQAALLGHLTGMPSVQGQA